MALVDVSNDPAHARGAKAAGFSIPGLTKPALVAEKPAAKASKEPWGYHNSGAMYIGFPHFPGQFCRAARGTAW